ncbi:hypothetical protein [Vreelandella janggokensis]|uniref:hypothetical protein n=1 Tax=Vreelandella janggokensis TaxID=370767 RepID=UPI0028559798|nr:hypothetical protein [Halomonas janggokensis]MDR5887571.1 hypothetical protein [Halomonas janggokensis]
MANQRLNATISIGGTVAKSLTRGLTDTRGQLADVGGAINKATRRQTVLSREIGKMGRQGMNVEPLRREYAQLSNEIDRARRKQEALQRLAGADVAGKFGRMTSEVGRLARRTAMLGGAVGVGIFGVANSTAELGDNVAKTADKLGMGIEELQAYRYAAERSGVASKTFDMATQRMVRRVSEAANGTGEAKDAIKELGLSAEALASMTPDEQLNHFADALQNVENQGERVRLAMKLFDSEGVAMVNMLRGGSEQLNKFGEDARRTGYILSDAAARDAETFKDTLLDTQLSLFGLKNIIGSALMPVVADMMGKFTGWLAENRNDVRDWSELFAEKLQAAVPIIRDLASGIGTVVANVGSAVATTAELVGGFDNLGVIIGTVFASKAIFSVVSFGLALGQAAGAVFSLVGGASALTAGITSVVGVFKTLGLALLATPIGWIVAGIAAIAGGAYLIYKHWESVGPWFSDMWEGVKQIAKTTWDSMKATLAWSPVGLIIRSWGAMATAIGSVVTAAKDMALAPWNTIKATMAWSPVSLIIRSWGPMAGAIGSVVSAVKDITGAAWDWMKAKLSWSPLEAVTNAWQGLTGFFSGLWDGITAKAEKALDWITGKLEWVGNAFSTVSGWIGDDDDSDTRGILGGASAASLTQERDPDEAVQRGQQAAERALPRPDFNTNNSGGQQSSASEKVKEVVNNITNNLTLHVTRRDGEQDASYAQRIADMVLEELNERQQGALYDG